MKRIIFYLLLILAAIAVVGGRAEAAPARATGTLVGTGATFPFPLISKWIPEVGKAYGIDITYSPTGSGAGIAAVTARTVDFGASDAPLSDQQLADCRGCVVVPWLGREDGERGEAFAALLQAETGCLVADRRNGRIVELGAAEGRAAG